MSCPICLCAIQDTFSTQSSPLFPGADVGFLAMLLCGVPQRVASGANVNTSDPQPEMVKVLPSPPVPLLPRAPTVLQHPLFSPLSLSLPLSLFLSLSLRLSLSPPLFSLISSFLPDSARAGWRPHPCLPAPDQTALGGGEVPPGALLPPCLGQRGSGAGPHGRRPARSIRPPRKDPPQR